jgi:predicted RNase H-like HicB family nuclease
MKYRVTLVKSEEGWAVWCDDLPGCCSQGTTRAEAVGNIRSAIREYLAAKAEEILAIKEVGALSIQHLQVLV